MIYLPEEVLYSAVIGFFSSLAMSFFFNRKKRVYNPTGLVKTIEQSLRSQPWQCSHKTFDNKIVSKVTIDFVRCEIIGTASGIEDIYQPNVGSLLSYFNKYDMKHLNKVWKDKIKSNKEEVIKKLQA